MLPHFLCCPLFPCSLCLPLLAAGMAGISAGRDSDEEDEDFKASESEGEESSSDEDDDEDEDGSPGGARMVDEEVGG